ncbi:MAG: PAS domain S-box protein [Desulfomonilaceae bacterium]|nr:PAS domain S-box protein [Desulfomonilaceae bacterium]
MPTRILIVEDEGVIAKNLVRSLSNVGYEIAGIVDSGEDALRVAEASKPDLVLMDIKLTGTLDGVEAADRIRSRFDIPVVYLTGYTERDVLERAKKTEPYGYLGKPSTLLELRSTIETAIYKHQADKRVRESEERYRSVVRNAAEAIVVIQDLVCKFVNPKAIKLSGYSEDELVGMPLLNLVHPDDRPLAVARYQQMLADGAEPGPVSYRFVDKNGNVRWLEINTVIITWEGRNAGLSLASDVTDRRRVERTLRESEERYRQLVENSMTGIYTHENGVFTYVNQRLCDMMGYSSEEIVGEHFWNFVHPDDREAIKRRGLAISQGERLDPYVEFRVLCKNGETRWFQVLSTPMSRHGHTANLGNVADITDRKRAEERIRESLREKEVMLREIHHRVKNNLAVIVSLLGLQSQYGEGVPGHNPFEELQDRIRSMALAHEFLYQSDNLADLRIDHYIDCLVSHLVRSIADVGTEVVLTKEIDPISFNLDTAIPTGFLLTELISNCLKHAFPTGSRGEIRLSLHSLGEGQFELIVADNGVGMPEDVDLSNPRSLGLDLVGVFVTQLQGTIEIRRDQGTEVRIRFKEAARKRTMP